MPHPRPTRPAPVPRRHAVVALGALWLAPLAHARVPFWGGRESEAVTTAADALGKGQWVWMPETAPTGPVLVLVNLASHRAFAYRNGVLIGYTTISSGRSGFDTPTGVFHTLQKDKNHHSSLYNSAPMPYTQRLTWGGIALHAGGLPGYPSSHGCVHLPSAFAGRLFDVSPLGMTVIVAGNDMVPINTAQPALLSPFNPASGAPAATLPLSDTEAFRWTPERAAAGPVSVVLSRADQRVIVMRNGVEIGRARFALNDASKPFGTHVFVALGGTGAPATDPLSPRWVGTSVPGRDEDAGAPLTAQDMARVRLPDAFLARLLPIIGEGTTLLVTDDPILPTTTGPSMTVVTNNGPTG